MTTTTTITYPPIIANLGGAERVDHDGQVARVTRGRVTITVPWERLAPIADDGMAVWVAAALENRTTKAKRAAAPAFGLGSDGSVVLINQRRRP